MGSTDERYVFWNYMLAEHCLLAKSHDGTVLLTVTPGILAAAHQEADAGALSAEDAESAFTEAVSSIYCDRVLTSSRKLRELQSPVADSDVPLGLSFLALSVLAAFHMRTDNQHSGRAFYPRLAKMLRCEMGAFYPEGFDGQAFVDLWTDLAEWLRLHYDRELAIPSAIGAHRYMPYPLAHVALRQVDLNRLPQFFTSHGYDAGVRAPLDRLAHDLVNAAGPWRGLTESGQQALADANRRPFVVQQVAHELEHWDGSHTDSTGVRIANIEVWLDIHRRRVRLSLLARRPDGFPDRIEGGTLVFESSQEGWYEPVQLGPDDGSLLRQGFRIDSGDGAFSLQLRASEVIPLTPSDEFAGFVSDSVLRSETQNAVLCSDDLAADASHYIQTLNPGRAQINRDENVPAGWVLFTDVRPPATSHQPPAGLERLCVETSIALVAKGGLRLGRQWSWLESAPARLMIIGAHNGIEAKVDGIAAEIDPAGSIASSRLNEPGIHIVEIGNRLRQRVAVLPATVHPDCVSWDCAAAPPVAIPSGQWVLTGSAPGECEAVFAPPEGVLVRPLFSVRWGVRASAGRGATAVHIHDDLSSHHHPHPDAGKPYDLNWAETVYQAGIRRPQFFCPMGCSQAELRAYWRAHMQLARKTKRQSRRRR
jgi:hypothetical protein